MAMFEERIEWVRRFTQEDLLASALKSALALTGPFGGVIGEFLTQFIPQQRLDRLHDWVEQLNDRLKGLEAGFERRLQESAAYSALAEQAAVAAVQTPSHERRRDLAELLRTGLSTADAELLEHHALLRLLTDLNDVQVILLMGYGSFRQTMGNSALGAFYQQHPGVFDLAPPVMDSSVDDRRRWAMHEHYIDDLIAKGLLRDTEGIAKSSRAKRVEITRLGSLLLRAIGRPVADVV